jgi:flagellar biosynthetic protein FliO
LTAEVSPWTSVLTSLVALGFVLALAWVLLRWLKRSSWGAQAASGAGPRVLRAVSLGPRERLVVVQHHDVELLLGVTPAGISVLERRRVTEVAVGTPAEPALERTDTYP